MSLAVFALVVVIWMVLLVPLARRGRAELAYEASEGGRRLSSGGARPWTTGNLPAEPTEDELAAVAAAVAARLARRRAARRAATRRRRVLLVLVVAMAAGSRSWAVLGGRWWLAAAGAGFLLAGYLLSLVAVGWRRARRRTGSRATGVPRVTAAATA
jgi:membrane protein YdbS with pleckstrin-like domain